MGSLLRANIIIPHFIPDGVQRRMADRKKNIWQVIRMIESYTNF